MAGSAAVGCFGHGIDSPGEGFLHGEQIGRDIFRGESLVVGSDPLFERLAIQAAHPAGPDLVQGILGQTSVVGVGEFDGLAEKRAWAADGEIDAWRHHPIVAHEQGSTGVLVTDRFFLGLEAGLGDLESELPAQPADFAHSPAEFPQRLVVQVVEQAETGAGLAAGDIGLFELEHVHS